MTKPNAVSLGTAGSQAPNRTLPKVLGRLIRGKSAPSEEILAPAGKRPSAGSTSSIGQSAVIDELLSTAFKLVQATENSLQFISQPGLDKTAFLQRSKDLLSLYDEYLTVLKREIESIKEPFISSLGYGEWTQTDLIKLFVAFDHDRDLLAGIFGQMQHRLFGHAGDTRVAPKAELEENGMEDGLV